ncbi:MAG: dihydropteroate synthase [Candidatus Neomarinimicrobiota bacterium]|nr:dihydropteroate synthase [Candidatus Neomarinimicrobiota bacterium]
MINSSLVKNINNHLSPTLIMGIVNVTPDSFSDGGKYYNLDKAIEYSLELVKQGVDIIDVGGESTRPGANAISFDEEIERVIPVIKGIRSVSSIPISIDTYKSEVAKEALDSGADIVNDISGLNFDSKMISVIKDYNVPIVIMHIKGTPKNMQLNPEYDNIIDEIMSYFEKQINLCLDYGIPKSHIILDPGIGFGKQLNDNFILIRELNTFADLGYPILIGPSRKSFIGLTLDLQVDERLEGTAAAITASIINGARIVRVHDVLEMKRVQIISDKIRGATA